MRKAGALQQTSVTINESSMYCEEFNDRTPKVPNKMMTKSA